MQQKNKKRYIVFDPDDSTEEMVLRINNEMTKTCEQLEAEAEALRLWFEQQAKIPEWQTLYANEIEATIDCYLQNNPKVKRQAFTDTLHGFLKQADRFATTPADKKNAIMQVLISFI